MSIFNVKDIYRFINGLTTDTITEATTDVGVTIEGVLLKDGEVDGSDMARSVSAKAEVVTYGGIPRYDSTTGRDIQSSVIGVDDNGNVYIEATTDASQSIYMDSGISTSVSTRFMFRDRGVNKWGIIKDSGQEMVIYNYTLNAYALYIEASNNYMALGHSTPLAELDILAATKIRRRHTYTDTSTAYEIISTDSGTNILMNSAVPTYVSLTEDNNEDLPINTELKVTQQGVGLVTLIAQSGTVTLNGVVGGEYVSQGIGCVFTLIKIAANTWLASCAGGTGTIGELYITDGSTATVINTVDVWEHVTGYTTGEADNIDIASSVMTVVVPGRYHITGVVAGVPLGSYKTMEFAISINDVILTKSISPNYFANLDKVAGVSIGGVTTLLDVDDEIRVEIRGRTDATNFTVKSSNIVATRIR